MAFGTVDEKRESRPTKATLLFSVFEFHCLELQVLG